MSARLTVIFYIILCLEAGLALTFLPWVHPFGLGDWGDNFFLIYVTQKTGLHGLQPAISSGWVRGAVTGLGLINLALAFWEITHFRRTVRAIRPTSQTSDVARLHAATAHSTSQLPDQQRRDDAAHHSGK